MFEKSQPFQSCCIWDKDMRELTETDCIDCGIWHKTQAHTSNMKQAKVWLFFWHKDKRVDIWSYREEVLASELARERGVYHSAVRYCKVFDFRGAYTELGFRSIGNRFRSVDLYGVQAPSTTRRFDNKLHIVLLSAYYRTRRLRYKCK